jgi:formyltetrahydrofolate-dependent phosphoribosylglycinamide formyltransferase
VLSIGVLISGGGTSLENLAARIADGRLAGVRIGQVISSRARVRGVEIARQAGLPLEVIRRQDFAGEDPFSAALSATLDRAGVELAVLAGFLCHWRLPRRYEFRALNMHPALLPRFGGQGMYGRHVHEAVLAAGEQESGCTVHVVDALYDHGPIVAQRRVPVRPDDTPDTLAARVMAVERELYPEVLGQVAQRGVAWLRTFADAARGPAPS